MALGDSAQHLNEVHKPSSQKSQYLHLVSTREIDSAELNLQVKLFLLELMPAKDPGVGFFCILCVCTHLAGFSKEVCFHIKQLYPQRCQQATESSLASEM